MAAKNWRRKKNIYKQVGVSFFSQTYPCRLCDHLINLKIQESNLNWFRRLGTVVSCAICWRNIFTSSILHTVGIQKNITIKHNNSHICGLSELLKKEFSFPSQLPWEANWWARQQILEDSGGHTRGPEPLGGQGAASSWLPSDGQIMVQSDEIFHLHFSSSAYPFKGTMKKSTM